MNSTAAPLGRAGRRIVRLVVALLPLASVPLLVDIIAGERFDFGGGEKDLVWVLPWTLWALIFAASSLLLWKRGATLARATMRAALIAFAGVLLAALALAAAGRLGVAGRF